MLGTVVSIPVRCCETGKNNGKSSVNLREYMMSSLKNSGDLTRKIIIRKAPRAGREIRFGGGCIRVVGGQDEGNIGEWRP